MLYKDGKHHFLHSWKSSPSTLPSAPGLEPVFPVSQAHTLSTRQLCYEKKPE